jgi:hypothetical protein
MKIEATLVTAAGERYELETATFDTVCYDGVKWDDAEVEKIAGCHLECCDGDLGRLCLWQKGNYGDPDAYIEYDPDLHDLEWN